MRLTPEESSALAILAREDPEVRVMLRALTSKDSDAIEGVAPLLPPSSWRQLARLCQIRPDGAFYWAFIAGRGAGKTRAGAERVRERVTTGVRRIGVVSQTVADSRDVMLEGVSGIIPICEGMIRKYNRALGEVQFHNGSALKVYSDQEPDKLRGPAFSDLWLDELCAYENARATFYLGIAALRAGKTPECIITTTPRPDPLLREIIARDNCKVTRGSMYDNRDNLPKEFLRAIEDLYGDTRLAQQEIHGEILEGTEGALFKQEWINSSRLSEIAWSKIEKVVIGIDPSIAARDAPRGGPEFGRGIRTAGDECGIAVVALSKGWDEKSRRHVYVLYDGSGFMSPMEWGARAKELADHYGATSIVVERNQGGQMVVETLKTNGVTIPILAVHASESKRLRAEPVASLYEQQRVHHAGERRLFDKLELEMTSWDASDPKAKSPNRLDALVWGVYGLIDSVGTERPKLYSRITRPKVFA